MPMGKRSLSGPLAGQSLPELVGLYGRDLIGTSPPDSPSQVSLLLKILDANDYLSFRCILMMRGR